MSEEPFGRQPLPVTVIIIGEAREDVEYWANQLRQRSEFKGDMTQQLDRHNVNGTYIAFKIFPRAVND